MAQAPAFGAWPGPVPWAHGVGPIPPATCRPPVSRPPWRRRH